jgi:hypothetical protein
MKLICEKFDLKVQREIEKARNFIKDLSKR